MAIKEKLGKVTYWKDGEGALVPEKLVQKSEKERDALVEGLVADAIKLRAVIAASKAAMEAKIENYLESVAEQYGESWQGNARIRNYSQTQEVEINVSKLLTFDETLAVAKVKIDGCIGKWAGGSRRELVALVNQAFRVNQKGQVDVKALLKLPQLDIDDEDWQEAMEIIKSSVKVLNTRQYINFRFRLPEGTWETVVLNFSAI